MRYVPPDIALNAFNCPFCGAYAHMEKGQLFNVTTRLNTPFSQATCSNCKEASLWHFQSIVENGQTKGTTYEMTYPDFGIAPLPAEDMPLDVTKDYQEAARIFSKSPRGAAALLRLGLQKLCKHLGEDGVNINENIRSLAQKNTLPPLVIKVADTVRITGNNAVHPGEMCDEDFDKVASKMFDLLNFIVKKGISEPNELKALYEIIPEGARISAEKRDLKAKDTKSD